VCDEVALVEVERVCELLLRLRAEVGERGEDAVMDQDEVVLGQGGFQVAAAELGQLREQVRRQRQERGGRADVIKTMLFRMSNSCVLLQLPSFR
jgi:hypothetical protein